MAADLPPAADGGPDGDATPEFPPLAVGADGRAVAEFVEPRLGDVTRLWHRSLVVHDEAGRRVACGVLD
jgi:Cu/Zn superoxide dismutase